MPSIRTAAVLIGTALALVAMPGAGGAEPPAHPPRSVPCPVPTDDPARYPGASAPYRCHSAVVDPVGRIVILREGRTRSTGANAFGRRHVELDRGVTAVVIERVVSSALPVDTVGRRQRYSADVSGPGGAVVSVQVEVDRARSHQAPDTRPFGVITAYCVRPTGTGPERCPSWVDAAL